MKILAFTDIHADKESIKSISKKSKEADILLCCGDFTNFGIEKELVLKRLASIGKPLILIHGNHEEGENIRELCTKFKNINYIHKKAYNLEDITFVGYGGGGFSRVNLDLEFFASKIKDKIKNKLILVTHGPPANTKLDYLPWAGHVGCTSIRKAIEKLKPDLFFCGHLHETFNKTDKIGKTYLINPGDQGKIIEIK